MPPPSPPALTSQLLRARGGKGAGGKHGKGSGGNSKRAEEPLQQRCRQRSEAVIPLEKNGFYKQMAGYCASLYPYAPAGTCSRYSPEG